MTTKAIVLLSGGVDSVTSLYWAVNENYEVIVLSFNYKGRPEKEKDVSKSFASLLHLKFIEVDVPYLMTAEQLLKEHYPADYKTIKDDGYIPAKNLIFYSIACFYAEALGAEYIVGGHINEDHDVYPDASRSFFDDYEKVVAKGLVTNVKPAPKVLTPLINLSKEQVGILAKELHVPLEKSWSCYKNGETQCGTCLSCQERAKALQQLS